MAQIGPVNVDLLIRPLFNDYLLVEPRDLLADVHDVSRVPVRDPRIDDLVTGLGAWNLRDGTMRRARMGAISVTPNCSDYVREGGLWLPPPRDPPFTLSMAQVLGALVSAPQVSVVTSVVGYLPKPEVERKSLRRCERDTPFVGYKMVRLVAGRGAVRIRGHYNQTSDVDERAMCGLGMDHRPADPDCDCGFYAHINRPTWMNLDRSSHDVLVKVELFGQVVKGTYGYRAERQRLVSAEIPRRCEIATMEVEEVCEKRAAGIAVSDDAVLYPVCADHAPFGVTSLEQVGAALGVPVTWLEVRGCDG